MNYLDGYGPPNAMIYVVSINFFISVNSLASVECGACVWSRWCVFYSMRVSVSVKRGISYIILMLCSQKEDLDGFYLLGNYTLMNHESFLCIGTNCSCAFVVAN